LIRGTYRMKIIEYSEWKNDYKPILESFNEKRILFGFSGGTDSSLGLDLILRAKNDFGFDFEVHVGAFPRHRYTTAERRKIDSYWSSRDIDIVWHDVTETDDIIRDSDNPCYLCQTIRRKLLKSFVNQKVSDLERLVIITNYSLWDIVGYTLEHILAGEYSDFDGLRDTRKSKRFRVIAQRFYPILQMKEGYTIFRPLIKYNGCDIIYTLEKKGIPVLSIPCEFKEYRPKRGLERYYEQMGLRFDYDKVFEFAKRTLDLPDISVSTSIDKDTYLEEVF
jgi:tRNA(Ile)-lysidine synthase TilS/MesJ